MFRIWITLFIALLILPGASLLVGARSELLGGVTNDTGRTPFTWRTLANGSYQQRFERILKRSLPIWPTLVRTENQLNFSLFAQIGGGYKPTVVLGKENSLIERVYLRSANRVGVPKRTRIEKRVQELSELQQLLAQRGIPLLLLLSPNKPSMYPELLPDQFSVPGREDRVGAYELLRELLDAHGVNYLDSRAFLQAQSSRFNLPFFASSGTHWDEHAACLVTRELVSQIGAALARPIGSFTCEPVEEQPIPSYADRDLSRIINIWTPERTYSSVLKPQDKTIPIADGARRPKLLFEGTSFIWAILEYLHRHRTYDELAMFYYFKRRYSFPGGNSQPLREKPVDWEDEVFGADAIVIEINEAFPHQLGHGFLREAIDQLRGFRADGARSH